MKVNKDPKVFYKVLHFQDLRFIKDRAVYFDNRKIWKKLLIRAEDHII